MLPVRIPSRALPSGIGGVRVDGGFVEVETQSISGLSGDAGSVVVGIVDAVEGFTEEAENSQARLRIALCSSTRDKCIVTLFGDLAWACRSMGVAVTMVVSGARFSFGGRDLVGPRVAGCVPDQVLVCVEAAYLRKKSPQWSQEDAERVVRNRLAAFRKQRQRSGDWPEAPVAALNMRAERCWLCGDAWQKQFNAVSDKCASWPVCGARRLSSTCSSPAISVELAPGASFRIRRLPAPRGEPTDLLSIGEAVGDSEGTHYPIDELDSTLTNLKKKAGEIRGLRVPPPAIVRTLSKWRQRDSSLQTSLEEKIPQRLRSRLLPFQVEGVRFCLERKRALVADEMGLGKTLQAIAVAAAVRDEAWPLMVVCPAGVRSMWANEIENWLEIEPKDLVVIKGQSDAPPPPPAPPPRVVIVSFNMLERLPELSREAFNFGTVIVDEAQNLQTSTSQLLVRTTQLYESAQTRVTCSVAAKAKVVVMLSGTPALIRPVSTFALFESLAAGCTIRRHWLGSRDTNDRRLEFARYWAGARRHRVKHRRNNRTRYDAIAFPDELNAVLAELFMIRRLKKDVLAQLPPLRRRVVRLGEDDDDSTKVQRRRMHNVDDFQQCGLAKVDRAARWIVERVATRKQKLVVFAHHIAVIDGLHAAIEAARRDEDLIRDDDDEGESNFALSTSVWYGRTERIDGSTTSSSRERITRDFRRLDEFKILLVSITAGGVGIDLSRATEAVFVESVGLAASWLRQAEDRLHRRGQRSAVSVFYLLGPRGSWDNVGWPALDSQLGANTSVFNGAQSAELFSVQGTTPPKDDPSQHSPVVAGGQSSPEDDSPASSAMSKEEEEIASWKWCCADASWTPPPSQSQLAFAVSSHTGRLHVFVDLQYTGQSFETEALLAVVETGRRSGASGAREAARRRLPKAMRQKGDAARLAAKFIAEWETLSSRQRDIVLNKPVALPLADAVASLDAARARERQVSKRRHLDRNDLVASGTHYHQACEVRYVRRGNNPPIARYVCPADSSAKCLVCDTFFQCSIDSLRYDNDDESGSSRLRDFKRKNMADLFCGPTCREAYKATTSASGLRTVVFARDAGVCAKCGTDGHRLVERLIALRGADWGKRYRLALEFNPRWADHRAHLRKLVETPREGLAWEADHEIRVADGGGAAQADQVQTLCVPCHRAKTKLENTKKTEHGDEEGTEDGAVALKRRKTDFEDAAALTPPPLPRTVDDVLFSDEEVEEDVSGEPESVVEFAAASDGSFQGVEDFSWLDEI